MPEKVFVEISLLFVVFEWIILDFLGKGKVVNGKVDVRYKKNEDEVKILYISFDNDVCCEEVYKLVNWSPLNSGDTSKSISWGPWMLHPKEKKRFGWKVLGKNLRPNDKI